jgi:hypothetical protein
MDPFPDVFVSLLRDGDVPVAQFLFFLLNSVQDNKPLTNDRPAKEPVLIT